MQGAGLEQSLFGLLAGGVVGADQQIADDHILGVAQRRHRDHRREATAILAEIGQFVDILDAAGRLEHQGFEAGLDLGSQLDAEGLGPGDHLLRIGDVGGGDLVHHLGGGVAEHAFGPDVENLNHAVGVGGDAGKVLAVEDGALQGAGLEQSLFGLLAGGVVGADQQIADDHILGVAQRRHRDHRREATAILAEIGQFVDILDAAGRLEHQGFEAGLDLGSQLDAEGLGPGDHLLRIGDVGGGDLVHHLGGGVAEHAFGPDVENLNHAVGVGGDAGKVLAVEDGALQGAGLEQSLFGLLAGGVVGADQQIADDHILGVAQRRHRDHRREATAILAEIGQFVDILDAAGRLEHQGFEAGLDLGSQLDAEGLGPGDHLLRIGDVGGGDLVHHLGGGVAEHAFGPDVENLNHAVGVGGDAGKVGAVEDGVLQRPGSEQGLLTPNLGDALHRAVIETAGIFRHSRPPFTMWAIAPASPGVGVHPPRTMRIRWVAPSSASGMRVGCPGTVRPSSSARTTPRQTPPGLSTRMS